MKRFLISTISCLALAISAMADPITPSRALLLAKQFMPNDTEPSIQVAAKRTGKFDASGLAKGSVGTTSADSSAPYYIVSRGAGQGFVIVSGDDCLPQVLGVVEQGDYDENDLPDALREWLEYRAEQVEYAQAKGINTPFVSTAVVAGRVDVPYLVQTLWHQSTPYNNKCPIITKGSTDVGNRALTGCVATAASQIAYYWRKDCNRTIQYDTHTYSYGDAPVTSAYVIKKGTVLDWDAMANTSTAAGQDAVATLCAAVGMSSWLTYGSSTAGQISNTIEVFKDQLGLNGGICKYKDGNYTEAGWSQLLYNQLIQKRPVLYCGANSSGGHAVVCDGYSASTGFFHINFGWGGGYNGYFSVEDGVQGWGFNDSDQGCVYDIYPAKPNLETKWECPDHAYKGVEMKFNVKVTNNGTLPYSGIYLFMSSASTAPAKISAAKDSYTEEIPTGKTVSFDLKAKLTAGTKFYVTLTDASLNVLKKITYVVEKTATDISFKQLSVAASDATEELNGEQYSVVYNSGTTVYADISNLSSEPFYGGLHLNVFGYNADTQQWDSIGTKLTYLTALAKTEGRVAFSLTGITLPLSTGTYYYAVLSDSISSNAVKVQNTTDPGNIVRFILKGSDMEVVSFTDSVLTLKGHFDPTLFSSSTFAKRSLYSSAVAYDLTQCTGVTTVSQDVNPNALYYVSDDSKAEGANIVKGGHVTKLVLTPGYNFVPKGTITVDSAEITAATQPARWYMLTPPVTVSVPDGIAAREISRHYTSAIGLLGRVTDVTTLEAGKTYLVMTSSSQNTVVKGGAGTIIAAPLENKDKTVLGTYVNTTAAAGGVMLDDGIPQYLSPVSEGTAVEALRGYMCDSKVSVSMKTYKKESIDTCYIRLANDIESAYKTLDEYASINNQTHYDNFLAEIHSAEHVFTVRTDDTLVAPTYTALENASRAFMTPGDVNGDGEVNISDVNAIITVMCGGAFNSRADVNGDGEVNISDVNADISIICGE